MLFYLLPLIINFISISNKTFSNITKQEIIVLRKSSDKNHTVLASEMVEIFKHHNNWQKLLPSIMRKVQIAGEHNINTLSKNDIISFFIKNKPLTATGWMSYYNASKNNISQNDIDKLKEFWITNTSMTLAEQKHIANIVIKFMKNAYLARFVSLMMHGKIEYAKKFIEFSVFNGDVRISKKELNIIFNVLKKNYNPTEQEIEVLYNLKKSSAIFGMILIKALIKKQMIFEAYRVFNDIADYLENSIYKNVFEKLRLYFVRDILQYANNVSTKTNKKNKNMYQIGINILKKHNFDITNHPIEWIESNRLLVILYIFGINNIDYASDLLDELEEKAEQLPNLYRDKFLCCIHFFHGMCAKKSNKDFVYYFQKAANHPFCFYGQLSALMIDKKIDAVFMEHTKETEMSSNDLREIMEIATHWRKLNKIENKNIDILLNDWINLLKTNKDKSIFISFIKGFLGDSVTFFAKKITGGGKYAFREAYPMINTHYSSVPKELVFAIILSETAFNPNVVSYAGAQGIMQVIPAVAKKAAKMLNIPYQPKNIFDITYNVTLGSVELYSLMKKFNNRIIPIAAGYNAGEHKVYEWAANTPQASDIFSTIFWIESIPYKDTREYVKNIIANKNIYMIIMNKPITKKNIFIIK